MTKYHYKTFPEIDGDLLREEVKKKLYNDLNAFTTQREIALKQVGIGEHVFSRFVTGQVNTPSLTNFVRLCAWLDCPMEFFVTG